MRNWLAEIVPPVAGFVIEDKTFGVALHYRSADPGQAQAICVLLREFVARQAPPLVIREGKMVIEAIHPQAHKGAAVRTLLSAGNEQRLPVYFGDDITDEDAFYALREEGITVQVCGQPSATWARYRVGSPTGRDRRAGRDGVRSGSGSRFVNGNEGLRRGLQRCVVKSEIVAALICPRESSLTCPVARWKIDAMARITVEDCLEHVPNRFELVLVAAQRAKQLLKGSRPLVESDNKELVTALRETAAGKVVVDKPQL